MNESHFTFSVNGKLYSEMADSMWRVRNVSPETRKKIKMYALEHNLEVGPALDELIELALREEGFYAGEDNGYPITIKNKHDLVVYVQGLLNGKFGFTDEEPADPAKFKEHREDTARRHTANAMETKE